jgi:hypothetical protein
MIVALKVRHRNSYIKTVCKPLIKFIGEVATSVDWARITNQWRHSNSPSSVHFPGAAKSNIASSISAADEHSATETSDSALSSSQQTTEIDFAELKDGTLVEIVEDSENPYRTLLAVWKDGDVHYLKQLENGAPRPCAPAAEKESDF